MKNQPQKLDISSVSFDDMFDEGFEAVEEVEETEELEESEESEEEVDDTIENEEVEVEEESKETDESEDSEEDLESSSAVIGEIANTLGIELDGEYEDSVEGLTEFVRDISQQTAETQLQALFEQFPDVQKHLDYVLAGGDSEKFFETYRQGYDFGGIEIAEKDISLQRAVLGHYLKSKGHDEEFIEETLDLYEGNGKLYNKAQVAKEHLHESQQAQRQELIQQQRAEYARHQQETMQFWESVAEKIESGNEFAGIRIPDTQKSKFFSYISQPVGANGETQRDIDYAQAEMEVKLAIDYLMFNGFKLNDIIDKKARTKSVQSLKERIVSNQERVKNARQHQRGNTKRFEAEDLDSSFLFGGQ